MKKSLLSKHDSIRWLQTLVALVMTIGVFSVMWEVIALHTQRSSFLAAFDELETHVSSDDLLHLHYLQTGCRLENDTVFPWVYAAPGNSADLPVPQAQTSTSLLHRGDPRLVASLRQCPDVDIYLPSSARGPAGCAAVAGSLKFLQSRLLPDWVFDVELYDITSRHKTSYFELCPDTPMLFLAPEHVLSLTKHPSWPSTKPVYLMAPGLDLKSTSRAPEQFAQSVLERTDVVLCRTKRCDQDVKAFLEPQDSMDKKIRVIYTGQVTTDPSNLVRRVLGDGAAREKNMTDFASPRFAHTTWDISSKPTQDVMNCWSSHAKELPPLDVYLLKEYQDDKPTDGERLYKPFPSTNSTKIQILDPVKFARAFGNSSFFVCPTAADDCLDLARASGGVIVTAGAYPMNELVSASEGIFFPTEQTESRSDDSLLLPPAPVNYRSSDLCDAVLKARPSTSMNDRVALGTRARHHFNEDAKFFRLRMLELRAFARREQQDPNLRRPT
ncbi:hypothetical protein, variant [Phytophthora nicotianae]|uniref:Glycosyl transferase family 1 domain-containing protein n=4 Tax=Phytophthora nicotianae TaxID=4792 RepID=V9DZ70_PHYNI|nr:hypothetical protein F443_20948 [Phytophthora nicotianae P1569]ETL79217.1 hypothetical protein L917_20096 [Phytophthora nicotianae]ETO60928.1 hypothetical protein F444_20959 [Phytophthora nicotianae P1976]ETI32176.1 hypothetical protein, variant [Phytophthora nicotianae P1569]ETL79218.1 hypothetical protein, variant [Phytophthora nicotianae]